MMIRALGLYALISGVASAQTAGPPSIEGDWLGVISAGVRHVRVGVVIQPTLGGLSAMLRRIDPEPGEYPIPRFEFDGETLSFSLDAPNASYVGRFEGERITGVWTQKGMEFALCFERVDAVPASSRAQEPTGPLPYAEDDVRVDGAGGVVLAGTLATPASPEPCPAFVLISGSGAQDRDESAYGHRPFRVLSDALVRRGFAVLRLDDRGVGGSSGDLGATPLDELALDAIAACEFLRARRGIDPDRIGLIGHSEGGLVAALAANRARASRVIMLGTPALPIRELRAAQTEVLGRSLGASDAAIEGIRAFNRVCFDAVEAGQDEPTFRRTLEQESMRFLESLPIEEREGYRGLAMDLASTGLGYRTPWFCSLLELDPSAVIASVPCPALVIIGDKDVQVSALANIPVFEALLDRDRSRTVRMPSVNHMLQTCSTGAIEEYIRIEETIAPSVIMEIEAWLVGW